jgi:hypothetical protein
VAWLIGCAILTGLAIYAGNILVALWGDKPKAPPLVNSDDLRSSAIFRDYYRDKSKAQCSDATLGAPAIGKLTVVTSTPSRAVNMITSGWQPAPLCRRTRRDRILHGCLNRCRARRLAFRRR